MAEAPLTAAFSKQQGALAGAAASVRMPVAAAAPVRGQHDLLHWPQCYVTVRGS